MLRYTLNEIWYVNVLNPVVKISSLVYPIKRWVMLNKTFTFNRDMHPAHIPRAALYSATSLGANETFNIFLGLSTIHVLHEPFFVHNCIQNGIEILWTINISATDGARTKQTLLLILGLSKRDRVYCFNYTTQRQKKRQISLLQSQSDRFWI